MDRLTLFGLVAVSLMPVPSALEAQHARAALLVERHALGEAGQVLGGEEVA